MEMSRCILYEKNLPKEYWTEAANTAVFLLNKLPTNAINGKTPLRGMVYKPLIKNLKVFGCFCFTHVLQIKRENLDKKIEHGIFIGYSLISKVYRVFQPNSKKIIISKNVSFMENKEWNWINEKDKTDADYNQPTDLNQDEIVDDPAVHCTRSLVNIYQRCNVVVLELIGYLEAKKDPQWMVAMLEDLPMIE